LRGIAKKIVPQLLMGTAFLKVYLFLKMSRELVEESVVIAPRGYSIPLQHMILLHWQPLKIFLRGSPTAPSTLFNIYRRVAYNLKVIF
jgi:hypothetical protein